MQEGQTHTLSDETVELRITARRAGFEETTELLSTLRSHRDKVHPVYANLFERHSDDTELQGRQLFRLLTGELPDVDAIDHLSTLGLPDAAAALETIRALDNVPSLNHSRTATQNLLANLLAAVLSDLTDRRATRQVLNRLERVVSGSGAAATLYRSLLENDQLRDRLLLALGAADLFAQRLGRYPALLDCLVSTSLDMDTFRSTIDEGLERMVAVDLASAADPFRRFKAIEEFKVIVEWLIGRSLPMLSRKLSMLADSALGWVTDRAEAETLVTNSGQPADRWVVYALGKLGSRELTVHSNLDLVFLYEGDPRDSALFERQQAFVRTIYEFLEKPTAAGYAYRLDTRFRPEGRKGALAIPVASFYQYLETRAKIWERMAWTRCRYVAGSRVLDTDVSRAIGDFVYGSWLTEIPTCVCHVRERMERELAREASGDRLDLKVGKGGLADIDFLLQLLQIRQGQSDRRFRVAGTQTLLEHLPPTEYVDADSAGRLRTAYEFLRTLETVLRIESDTSRGWIPTEPARARVSRRTDRGPVSHG